MAAAAHARGLVPVARAQVRLVQVLAQVLVPGLVPAARVLALVQVLVPGLVLAEELVLTQA